MKNKTFVLIIRILGAEKLELKIAVNVCPLELSLLSNSAAILGTGPIGAAIVGLTGSPGAELVGHRALVVVVPVLLHELIADTDPELT